MTSCCNHTKRHKTCKRQDGKIFSLPRKFSVKQCKHAKGFTMKSSCAPYKYCKQRGGSGNTSCVSSGNAIAILNQNKDNVTGLVRFIPHKKGLRIEYHIKGLENGEHGFHIHEYGDLSEGRTSACSHFNPDNTTHGGLHSKIRHAGDLGNIRSNNKVAKGSFYASKLSLHPNSKYNILGRMIIVHEDRDDLGKGGDEESLKTGNAGKRVACGVIGLASNH